MYMFAGTITSSPGAISSASKPRRSVKAAAHSNGMLSTDEIRELLFEALHPRSEDVLGRGCDFVECPVDLPGDRLVLRHQADEGGYSCHLSRAGMPATMESGATSRVTTALAPTSARAPIRTPPRTMTPEPSEAPRSTTVRRRVQFGIRLGSAFVGGGAREPVVDEENP